MESKIAKKIFEQGARRRNPTLFLQYEELKRSEWLDRNSLENLQLKNARHFLEYIESNNHYYNKLFKSHDFVPSNFNCFDSLKVLPEIKKEELIKKNKDIHSTNLSEKSMLAETSGTSGSALSFSRNEGWDSLNRATMMRAYDWYGVKPWDRNGYLWGYNINSSQTLKIKFMDFLQNRYRLFNYSRADIKWFSERLQGSTFLSGYSSMIYEVAKVINEFGLEAPKLKMVKGTSEMILDIYSQESRKAFGQKVTSEYGAAEAGLIAFECPMGGLHVNIENLYLELNSENELLVTNFASKSFPIIRYNIGDSVTFDDRECPCGRAHPLIKDISGRKGAKVIGYKKSYPALVFYYVFKNLAIQNNILMNYKAVQHESGRVILYVEDESNIKYFGLIEKELTKYFGDDVDFKLEYVKSFVLRQRKSQYFESKLNVSESS